MKWNVLKAIFKRDFVSYFSSPTGYVFITVFVMLSALATFWPPEFFANNLANLDQLSRWLPFIMLVFIPAITMGVWAEERRQGTDELLLTIPASDFDVVLGKYLAGVAIFTVSLLFSALSIFTVFNYGLGTPDPGLFVSTYIGYWFIGIAMIAIGMVASFLTPNLTVAFILGMLLNLPLAMFGVADWFVKDPAIAEKIRRWSAVSQFGDFQRGILSVGGMVYFLAIAGVMIYLCMVLIGRRHWQARDDGNFMLGHYFVRAVALVGLAVGATLLVQGRNWLRADLSTEQLSTLSDDTRSLLAELRDNDDVKSVTVHAYVSPDLPAEYAPVKINLKSTLEEFRVLGGGKINVELHEIPNFGEEAELAEKNFGITPQAQEVVVRGEGESKEFFLGMAVTSGVGLEKVVTPFLNKGIPIEYELIRSIMTVTDPKRLRVGVVDTGIPLMSADGSQRNEWPLITELRKQYDVARVDPAQEIRGNYDVLLAVQPSMMSPEAFDNFLAAVRSGMPTAILEDPLPYLYPSQFPGTGEEKMSQSMMGMGMFGGGQPEPKGDIDKLWKMLGIEMNPYEVVWQDYSPEMSVRRMEDVQWVFIDRGNFSPEPFNDDLPISAGLNQLLLLYPGAIEKADDSKTKFEQVLQTGVGNSGTVPSQRLERYDPRRPNPNNNVPHLPTPKEGYLLAAKITGPAPAEALDLKAPIDDEHDPADDPENADQKKAAKDMNVVVVADVDWIIPDFFDIRAAGDDRFLPATQNVTFILNIIDALAGEDDFIDIRKRARIHRTLSKIDEATRESRMKAREDEDKFIKDITDQETKAREAMAKKIAEVEARTDLDARQKDVILEQTRLREQDKLDAQVRALAAKRSREIKQIEFDLDQNVRAVQDRYKLYAILIPPIPPLLLALAVFFRRRELERQGVSRERLR